MVEERDVQKAAHDINIFDLAGIPADKVKELFAESKKAIVDAHLEELKDTEASLTKAIHVMRECSDKHSDPEASIFFGMMILRLFQAARADLESKPAEPDDDCQCQECSCCSEKTEEEVKSDGTN